MKTVGLNVRESIIDEVTHNIAQAEGYIFISFSKVKAGAISRLRNALGDVGAKVFVAKNSLLKIAFGKVSKNELNGFLAQETALVFIYGQDIVSVCKALVDFSKENEALQLRGGFLKEQKLTAEGIGALAKLPSKEILLGMAVSGLASPIIGFLSVLNQVILKFVWVIEELKKQKTEYRVQSTENTAQKSEAKNEA